MSKKYLMESDDEIRRLELKTGFDAVRDQAGWAGLKPGMRVADIGCGSGKTSLYLKQLVGREGEVIGVDGSPERVSYAQDHHGETGISFVRRDIFGGLEDLGPFDFIWVRFFLEYHKSSSFTIVESLSRALNRKGILCLIDLDHNSLNHFDLPERLEKAIYGCARKLEERGDFDPYAGRKLYSYLYDLQFAEIDVRVDAHHLIFGKLKSADEFNWITKIAVAGKNSGSDFSEYPGGYEEFFDECTSFFTDPRRFTYSPVISCRGIKPSLG